MPTELRRSLCNRDCPDACALVAEVEDGQIRSLKGDPDHPVTQGFLCFRTSRYPELARGPERIERPMIRRGDRFEPIDGEAALDLAAERLLRIREESGPESIFHYRSGGSLGLLKQVVDRFFERLGPCTVKGGDICSGAGEEAQIRDFGVSDSNDLFDLLNAKHIVCWGKNPSISSVHTVKVLRDAKKQGSQILAIDPVRTQAQAFADEFVQPRPGGDLALALGVGRLLDDEFGFDAAVAERCRGLEGYRELIRKHTVAEWGQRADVPVQVLRDLARRLADGPTAILVGWGMQRRAHGAAIVRALDALSAVSGNLYRAGGGCSFYFARRAPFAALSSGESPRRVREPLFAQEMRGYADPPIRALWVTCGNPVNNLPDSAANAKAVEDTEFVVAVDCLWNDTNRRADLVLPIPNLLEDRDVLGSYGHHWVGVSEPLIDAPGQVRHELEWVAGLAKRMGFGDEFPGDVDHWRRQLVAPLAEHGMTLETLREGAVKAPGARQVRFAEGRVDTADGRVNLLQESDLADGALDRDADARLFLFSNSHRDSQCGQWATKRPEQLPVRVHPTRVPEGLEDGDRIVLTSEIGRLEGQLVVDETLRSDCVLVPKGGSFDEGTAANILIPARLTDHGEGAALLDCRVSIEAR